MPREMRAVAEVAQDSLDAKIVTKFSKKKLIYNTVIVLGLVGNASPDNSV